MIIPIVPDTNVIISGMITPEGATRSIINLSFANRIILYGSDESYKEFKRKIKEPRLQKYLKKQYFSPEKIILDYQSYMNIVNTFDILKDANIVRDIDDNEYLRIAKSINSRIIVSRDKDLLILKKFEDILIITPEKFLDGWRNSHNGRLF